MRPDKYKNSKKKLILLYFQTVVSLWGGGMLEKQPKKKLKGSSDCNG